MPRTVCQLQYVSCRLRNYKVKVLLKIGGIGLGLVSMLGLDVAALLYAGGVA